MSGLDHRFGQDYRCVILEWWTCGSGFQPRKVAAGRRSHRFWVDSEWPKQCSRPNVSYLRCNR